jgi:predicted component of type VI protein secretion system
MLERDPYPALARGCFELYQQFLVSSEEVARRVGASVFNRNRRPSLQDIQADYDIKFVGSSMIQSKEAKLQFLERAWAVFGQIPGAAPTFPWRESLLKWLELADLRDIEEMVGDPQGVEDFIARSTAQPGAKGGGVQRPGPVAMNPAQLSGDGIGLQGG